MLLDIQMPDMDGFEVIAELGIEKMPQVVFATAYNQHAIRAFEVNAVDYIIKPYTTERFNEAVDRALLRIPGLGPRGDERLEAMMQRLFGEEANRERSAINDEPGSDRLLVKDRDRHASRQSSGPRLDRGRGKLCPAAHWDDELSGSGKSRETRGKTRPVRIRAGSPAFSGEHRARERGSAVVRRRRCACSQQRR